MITVEGLATVTRLRPVREHLVCSLCQREPGEPDYDGECYTCFTCSPAHRPLRAWTDEQLVARYTTVIDAAVHGLVNGVHQQTATRVTAELLRRGIDPRDLATTHHRAV